MRSLRALDAGARSVSELEVLFADNHLLAVAKPAGLPVVPDASGDESLFDRAKAWVKRAGAKPGAVYLGVVHRLDRPVSGVVVFARTSKAAARLSEAFRERRVAKTYWGLGAGRLETPEGVLEQWLEKDAERNVVRVVEAGRGRLAVTRYRVRGTAAGTTWLELEPLTGRPHQLRVAARALGAPFLGDLKYGAREPLPDQSIALHALTLELEHPVGRRPLTLRAEPPRTPIWEPTRLAQ